MFLVGQIAKRSVDQILNGAFSYAITNIIYVESLHLSAQRQKTLNGRNHFISGHKKLEAQLMIRSKFNALVIKFEWNGRWRCRSSYIPVRIIGIINQASTKHSDFWSTMLRK